MVREYLQRGSKEMQRGDWDETRWYLIYAAVAVNTLVVYAVLWWFSQAYS